MTQFYRQELKSSHILNETVTDKNKAVALRELWTFKANREREEMPALNDRLFKPYFFVKTNSEPLIRLEKARLIQVFYYLIR